MMFKTELFGKEYAFSSLKEVMAKASEEKTGDQLAGIHAKSMEERICARKILATRTVEEITKEPVVPYDEDEVTRLIIDRLDPTNFIRIKDMQIGELRELLLDHKTDGKLMLELGKAMTGEVIASLAKLMTNMDLILLASKMEVKATCVTTVGEKGCLSSRLQPNHQTDDPEGIMASLLEGLSYGVGDAVIGINPVNDSPDNLKQIMEVLEEAKTKYEIPTQTCVLGHIKSQLEAMKRGGKADLLFQSIAGSEKGNREFGIDVGVLLEGYQYMQEHNRNQGKALMYFETGQGSELSSGSHFEADQTTMEARCYCLARAFDPFLVNSVVGFIGPEYLYDSKQVIRAGLEDHFMAKLCGIPMGVDVCYTNHMKADQNDMDNLSILLTNAGCNYLIGVPATDDIMLYYQSLGYHDIASLRQLTGKRPTKEFAAWMEKWKIDVSLNMGNPTIFLEHVEEFEHLQSKTNARNQVGRAGTGYKTDTILSLQEGHAAAVDSVMRDVDPKWIEEHQLQTFSTACQEREVFLLRPDQGRVIPKDQIEALKKFGDDGVDIQIYISDGLSASAVEANGILTYEAICKIAKERLPYRIGECFFLRNGRVSASDYVGIATGAKIVCVLLGERPGLATAESMSAYITYKPVIGNVESSRTVVSNIHNHGLPPMKAAEYIVELFNKMMEQRTSGVDLVL